MPKLPDGTAGRRRHTTLSEYVLEELRNWIVLGQLAPGTRIEVDQLAAELGSSRIPVREAMRQLEAEGLIVNRPRHGVQVREMRLEDIDEAYDLLEYAEMLALKRAAKFITPAAIDEMRHWASEMKRLEHDSPSVEKLVAHRSFHFVLFDSLGDGPLLRHLRMLWHSCERYLVASMRDSDGEHVRSHGHGHEELIAMLAANPTTRELQAEMRQHLRTSRERAKAAFTERPLAVAK